MDLFFLVHFSRYLKPLIEIWENKISMLLFGGLATIANDMLSVFKTDIELAMLLGVVILVDFWFGLKKAKKENIPRTSLGYRQTIIKIIEYGAFILLLSGLANKATGYASPDNTALLNGFIFILQDIDVLAYFSLIVIEIKSITEKMVDKDGNLTELIDKIQDSIKEKEEENK